MKTTNTPASTSRKTLALLACLCIAFTAQAADTTPPTGNAVVAKKVAAPATNPTGFEPETMKPTLKAGFSSESFKPKPAKAMPGIPGK